MNKVHRNNSGFGLMPVLLVIVVIGAISLTGWLVTRNKNAQTSSNPVGQLSPEALTKQPTEPVSANPLIVSEWGITLPLSRATSDAYYVVSKSSQDANGQPNTMLLGLKSLDSSGCNADGPNTGKSTAVGALLRVLPTETDPVSGKPYTDLYPNGVVIGKYYYAFQDLSRGLSCASPSLLQDITSSFANDSKNISAD